MQVEWYNIWLEAIDNFEKYHQGKDTADIIQTKVLQVYTLKFLDIRKDKFSVK